MINSRALLFSLPGFPLSHFVSFISISPSYLVLLHLCLSVYMSVYLCLPVPPFLSLYLSIYISFTSDTFFSFFLYVCQVWFSFWTWKRWADRWSNWFWIFFLYLCTKLSLRYMEFNKICSTLLAYIKHQFVFWIIIIWVRGRGKRNR